VSKNEQVTLVLYEGRPDVLDDQRAVFTIGAARIVIVSNYADVRDAKENLVATLTWPAKYKVRRI